MRGYLRLFVAIVLLFLAIAPPFRAQNSSGQDTETIINEYMLATEALDLKQTLSLYGESIIWEDPGYGDDEGDYFTGKTAVEAMYRWLYALPDVQLDTTDYFISADGHRAAVEWVWSGTNGDNVYSIRGVSVLEIADSKIVHEVLYYDPTTAP